jgi:uncharacterized protein (DUF58 family)
VRLTARGTGLLLAGPALLAAGFALGYPEVAVLGSACLLAVAFGAGYAAWRPGLTVERRTEPDRVMRGETSNVTLTVHNTSRLRGATLVAYDRCGATAVAVPLLRLRPGRDTVVEYPVPTDRRGIVHIGPLRVERRDPLGLAVVARRHGGTGQVWVYPKAHPLTAVPVGIVRSLDGRVDRVPHGTITFQALREYVLGDELRHVHWRTSARVGQLMVREHVDTSLPRLVVLLDNRSAAHEGDSFEAACEAAASVVVAAHREELPLALQLTSGEHVGGDGRRPTSSRAYLDLLAEAELHADAGLHDAATRLRHDRAGDTLVYLTGPARAEDLAEIEALRGAYPTIVAGTFATREPGSREQRWAQSRAGSPGGDAETGVAERAPAAFAGMILLTAADGAEFAAEWDGVGRW